MNLGAPELVILTTLVVPVGLLAWWALRAPKHGDIELWAGAYGLRVTERNETVLRFYLTRQQRWRRLGFLGGLLLSGPVALWSDVDTGFLGYLLSGLGYSAGIVLAVLSYMAATGGAMTGAASLERRRRSQYLPGKLVWLPRALVLVGFASLLWSLDHGPTGVVEDLTDSQLRTLFAIDVGLLVVAEVLEQAVVRRRQPATEPDLVAADDAIRAQTLHALAGAAIISASSLLGPLLWRSVWGEAQRFDDALETIAFLAPALGWVAGIWYQNRAWRVRRSAPSGSVGTAARA